MQWRPAHQDVPGNEEADRHADQAGSMTAKDYS